MGLADAALEALGGPRSVTMPGRLDAAKPLGLLAAPSRALPEYNDQGEGLQPQFSSGMAGARTYGGNTIAFNGATPGTMPALAAGTYYLGTGLWPLDYLDTLTVPNRWHLRGTSGSSLQLGADLYAGNDGGGGPSCDPDVNQDGNVDQDDVAYLINVVGGGPNDTGIDPDFNQDGNVDQDDVNAIIDVVAGGPCP